MTMKEFFEKINGDTDYRNPGEFIRTMEKAMPGILFSVDHFIFTGQMLDEGFYDTEPLETDDFFLYGVTNGRKNGAISLFYPQAMERIACKLGGDYYVFPSSRHEMLIVPACKMNHNDFLNIVKEINETEVNVEDRLDDRVWIYKANTKTLEPVEG